MAENIASLLVELGLDSSKFDSSIGKIDKSTNQMKKSFDLAKDAIKNSEDKLSAYSNAVSKGQGVIDQYKTKLEALSKNYDKAGENVKKLVDTKKQLEQSLNNEKAKLAEIGQTLGKSSQAYKDQQDKVKGLEKELSNTDATIGNNISSMRKMENTMQQTSNQINKTENEVKDMKSEIDKLNNINLNGLTTKFKQASDSMVKMGDKLQSVGGKISSFGTKMSIGVTAPVMGIVGASAKARLALDQMTRKSKIVFGDMQKDVAEWSLANESAFGLGAGTIEGYTATIADLTQGLGMGKKASFEMAKGATELGVKLANWAGVMPDQAIDDVTKALAGSHKAMEKYGVKLNQNVLDEYTRKAGLGKTFNALTEAQKAQVRYNAILGSSENAVKNWDDGNRSAAFHLNKMKEMVGNLFEVLGEKLAPTIEIVVEKIGNLAKKFSDWAAQNPELLQQIIDIGLKLAIIAPIVGIVGKAVSGFGSIIGGVGKVGSKVFETLGKKATTSGDDIAKVGGKFQGLSGLMSNPYVLVGALVVLMAKLGESEGAILKLQEKFGGIGMVVGGVCEFISGLWDVTIGQMVNLVGFLSDALEAVFDGPGGKTIHDAQQRFNAKQEQTAIEGMEKLTLSTTRGMQTLRAMSDGQLQELNTTFDLALGNIASVGSGHFGEFAYSVAGSLDGMSSHSINTLQNLNDQTRLMFFGINESMTVDQRAGQIRENLERMKTSGTLDVNELKSGIESAMQMANSQLDVKPSTDKVEGDLAQMANSGSQEAQKLASNVASEAGKIPDAVKPVNQVPKIVEDAMNNANNVNKNGYTQMQQNTINQLGNMLNDIRGKFQDMIKAMVDTVNGGVQSVDSAFMRVFNAVKNIMINLKIEVSNQMSAIRDEMSKPIAINVSRKITTQSVSLPPVESQSAFDMSVYDINSQARYSSNGMVAQGFKQSTPSNDDIVDALIAQNKMMDLQNKLLTKLLAKESNFSVESTLLLDSRVVAKQIAQPMQTELSNLDKRKARLGGNF